jgi:hypothetical protein
MLQILKKTKPHSLTKRKLVSLYQKAIFNKDTGEEIEITNEKNEFLLALNKGGTYKNETYDLPQNIKNKISGKLSLAYGNN